MEFLTVYHTDIGNQKSVNQDALLIKTANSSRGNVGFFVMCDGMGGLSKGEMSSATAIMTMSRWFEKILPTIILSNEWEEEIKTSIIDTIKKLNLKIKRYGEDNDLKLGTTLTILLIIENKYLVFHVGDSRAYKIEDNLYQITKDQSLVQREVDLGNITKEQAKTYPKRNILLQCIGVVSDVKIVVYEGKAEKNQIYMLCTDGFYHELDEKEIVDKLSSRDLVDEDNMYKACVDMVELVKDRGERDNISVLLVKII
ncbi:PP2C family protein-serine/threonine phosphatase [Inconstantimicrobium mannanitabidum]|uniref:Serine/threonine protein phosphatase n=1 Tax=Inconstantimicrobium mannanitabidum TaxID=1604901 RepID=A0ACB5RE83_9CLOT|nr:protein phosphatase 2C domain-containing protein [Clostridium sp. TW13]GKX67435.1 serine/threonine protein phosphatase [Clostridium sp. TW13]